MRLRRKWIFQDCDFTRPGIDAALWSYALEWNAALRVVGFFGDLVAAQTFVDGLPELEWKRFDETRRYREEKSRWTRRRTACLKTPNCQ